MYIEVVVTRIVSIFYINEREYNKHLEVKSSFEIS